jgi:hypothetical protein
MGQGALSDAPDLASPGSRDRLSRVVLQGMRRCFSLGDDPAPCALAGALRLPALIEEERDLVRQPLRSQP